MHRDLLAILVTTVVLFPNVIHAEESCGSDRSSIDLKYSIQGGTVKAICHDIEIPSLLVFINSTDKGNLNLEVLRDVYDPRNEDCSDATYFVLVDRNEVPYNVQKFFNSRIFTIPFELGSSEIEIVAGPSVMSRPYLIEGKTCPPLVDDILPPRQQITTGILSQDVVCKEGLKLIFKSKDNSPACVKPETADKLVERGWGTISLQPIQKTWVEIHPVNCVNYTNPQLQGCYINWLKDYYDSEPNQPGSIYNDPQFSFDANSEYIRNYFGKQNTKILDIKYSMIRQSFCEFGECFDGYKLLILVSNSNLNKMLDLGFKVSEKQTPN